MLTLTRIDSIGSALRNTIVTHKSNVALIEADRHRENGRWTYLDLRAEAERFGALLQSLDFGPGDRCAIIMQNQSKWIFSALGAFWAGATLVPIDYKLEPDEQIALLEHSRPRVLVTEYVTWKKLSARSTALWERTRVLVTEAPEDAQLGAARRWEATPPRALLPVDRTRDDVACIVYSSGTSGTPKGCMLTHDNYLEQAQALGRLFPIKEDDRYFSVLPTNHAIDFMVGFILPLLFGAAVVHQRTLRPQFLRASMKEYGITHMALVPTILKNLKTRIEDRIEDLPHWQQRLVGGIRTANALLTARKPHPKLSRTLLRPIHAELGGRLEKVFAGGTFVDREIADFFYDLGIPVVIGYGQTEATTVITVNDLSPYRGDTVGKAVEGVDVEIRDPNEDGIGEVCVRGRTVMKGYLDDPELTAQTIVDGWLHTGDLGTLDVSGHLRLVGRSKNMIVTAGGKNIYPEDVESVFEDLPEVDEFCVFAANFVWKAQTMLDEELVLALRLKVDDGSTSAEPSIGLDPELLAEIGRRNRRLPDYKRIAGVILAPDEFPRTASLKIKRVPLAEQLRKLPRETAVVRLEAK